MKKLTIFTLIFLLASIWQSCNSSDSNPEITKKELYNHIEFLASDSLKGRYPGTPEDKIAALYIAQELKKSGLELMFDEGLQTFEIAGNIKTGDHNSLMINNSEFKLDKDFAPVVFSASASVKAEVVFVGYGFKIEQGEIIWNDYKDVDVKGKWVLILRGEPENIDSELPLSMYSGLRSKAIAAKDQGAAGVIFVSGKKLDPADELIKRSKPEGELDIPVIQIKREIADIILKNNDNSIEQLEESIQHDGFSQSTGTTVNCQIELITTQQKTFNVAAKLITNPSKKYLIIGGHYDHLGMGGPGTGTRAPGVNKPHYGADDNASGVAAMLEIAEKMAGKKDSLNFNYIFLAFGAEEMGLVGSKHFVNNMPLEDSLIKAMINLDMLGRMKKDSSLQIGGVGTSLEGEKILTDLNLNYHFKLGFSQEGYGPSDHSSFYSKDIPVFFFSTGAHIDYHTPGDSLDNINFLGLVHATKYIYEFANEISSDEKFLTFQEAGPKRKEGFKRNEKLKVTLGIMPDFSGVEKRGLRADLVIKSKPADKAGMKSGDVIVAMDGYPVGDVYEYMERLSKFKVGQIITVEVIRDEEKEVLIVQL